MTIFLVILAILLVGGTALLASGRALPVPLRRLGSSVGSPVLTEGTERTERKERTVRTAGPSDDSAGSTIPVPVGNLGLVEPVASLPPVLLPDVPSAQDVDAVRFGLGLRGYRMDQVDEVLDRLAAAIAQRDAVITDLRAQLAARDADA